MRRVPPLVVDGLNTLLTPALNPLDADPEDVFEALVLEPPPPQAASPRLAAAVTASAAVIRVLLIRVPILQSGDGGTSPGPGQRVRGSRASRRPSPKRLKASTVTK